MVFLNNTVAVSTAGDLSKTLPDMVYLPLTPAMVQKLSVAAAKVSSLKMNKGRIVYGGKTSSGELEKGEDYVYTHTLSTEPGSSGAAILAIGSNTVLALHIGSVVAGAQNLAYPSDLVAAEIELLGKIKTISKVLPLDRAPIVEAESKTTKTITCESPPGFEKVIEFDNKRTYWDDKGYKKLLDDAYDVDEDEFEQYEREQKELQFRNLEKREKQEREARDRELSKAARKAVQDMPFKSSPWHDAEAMYHIVHGALVARATAFDQSKSAAQPAVVEAPAAPEQPAPARVEDAPTPAPEPISGLLRAENVINELRFDPATSVPAHEFRVLMTQVSELQRQLSALLVSIPPPVTLVECTFCNCKVKSLERHHKVCAKLVKPESAIIGDEQVLVATTTVPFLGKSSLKKSDVPSTVSTNFSGLGLRSMSPTPGPSRIHDGTRVLAQRSVSIARD